MDFVEECTGTEDDPIFLDEDFDLMMFLGDEPEELPLSKPPRIKIEPLDEDDGYEQAALGGQAANSPTLSGGQISPQIPSPPQGLGALLQMRPLREVESEVQRIMEMEKKPEMKMAEVQTEEKMDKDMDSMFEVMKKASKGALSKEFKLAKTIDALTKELDAIRGERRTVEQHYIRLATGTFNGKTFLISTEKGCEDAMEYINGYKKVCFKKATIKCEVDVKTEIIEPGPEIQEEDKDSKTQVTGELKKEPGPEMQEHGIQITSDELLKPQNQGSQADVKQHYEQDMQTDQVNTCNQGIQIDTVELLPTRSQGIQVDVAELLELYNQGIQVDHFELLQPQVQEVQTDDPNPEDFQNVQTQTKVEDIDIVHHAFVKSSEAQTDTEKPEIKVKAKEEKYIAPCLSLDAPLDMQGPFTLQLPSPARAPILPPTVNPSEGTPMRSSKRAEKRRRRMAREESSAPSPQKKIKQEVPEQFRDRIQFPTDASDSNDEKRARRGSNIRGQSPQNHFHQHHQLPRAYGVSGSERKKDSYRRGRK